MLEVVAGSRLFSTVFPDYRPVIFVTCAQCEPAFICEENSEPVQNLLVLVLFCKCQLGSAMLGCEHKPHL